MPPLWRVEIISYNPQWPNGEVVSQRGFRDLDGASAKVAALTDEMLEHGYSPEHRLGAMLAGYLIETWRGPEGQIAGLVAYRTR